MCRDGVDNRTSRCHCEAMSEIAGQVAARPSYSAAALDVALAEASRARSTQSARIAAMRSRAGILIGSSGIAAGLISAVAENSMFLLPIVAFLLAALMGVLSIAPGPSRSNTPATVLEQAEGRTGLQMRLWVLGILSGETAAEELRMKWPARFDRIGTWTFVVAIALVGFASVHTLVNVPPDRPQQIQIVES